MSQTPKQKDKESAIGCLGIVGIIVAGYVLYAFDWNFFSQTEITHYGVTCPVELVNGIALESGNATFAWTSP